MTPGSGKITVNNKDVNDYFKSQHHQYVVNQPFSASNTEGQYDVKANLDGGGVTGQAEALRLAISKALVEVDGETNRPLLRSEDLLTRDPRMVERKKFGRKKARKRFQFSKR
jgi:small subunit ribosomal protein S9